MANAYFNSAGWKSCVDAFVADLFAAAHSVRDDANSPIVGVSEDGDTGTPSSYGGRYPYFLVSSVTATGQSEAAERYMPAQMEAEVLVVMPATNPGGKQSGRGHAEEKTLRALTAWIDRLWDLGAVHARAGGNSSVDQGRPGSYDEFGRAMFVDEGRKVLWAQPARVRVGL